MNTEGKKVEIEERRLNGMYLFIGLMKCGCEWQGDVLSRKWAECLFFTEKNREQVEREVKNFTEGVDYKFDGFSIWVA